MTKIEIENINFLITKYNYFEGLAQALVKAKGKCVFCNEDLLETRLGYSSIVMDHLLPKKLYLELEWNFKNHVLSCSSCNSLKGSYDPLEKKEDSIKMITSHREQLIMRVTEYLKDKISLRKKEWEEIKERILNI